MEFILEGGTFTEYPYDYLEEFFTDFIYACNIYPDYLRNKDELRERLDLKAEINFNKTSSCKIIGICIETRPDSILENTEKGNPWLETLLSWGVTRLQLGMQHIDNFILKKINRGHTVEQTIQAIEICKNNCFKIDIHIMPDLPYSNPSKDKAMFDQLYKNHCYQPDQMKIYPCEIVPWTKIEQWYNEGKHVPYGNDQNKIQDVLQYAMQQCPPWIRLPRVVRDIPHEYISGGLKCGNMRQHIQDHKEFKGKDIRFREIGRHPEYDLQDSKLMVRKYSASCGIEYFISVESQDEKALFGFCRLRIPSSNYLNTIVHKDTLKHKGLIRELHVYGSLVGVLHDQTNPNSVQHSGIGKRLMRKAEAISLFNHGKIGCVVISGIGVRGYYEKLGYHLENHYMVKSFYKSYKIKVIFIDVIMFVVLLYTLLFNKHNLI